MRDLSAVKDPFPEITNLERFANIDNSPRGLWCRKLVAFYYECFEAMEDYYEVNMLMNEVACQIREELKRYRSCSIREVEKRETKTFIQEELVWPED